MSEGATAALVALVLAAIPFLLLGLLIAGFVLVIGAVSFLVSLAEQPIRYWFFAASVALDIILLVPLGLVSCAVSFIEPAVWKQAQVPVLVFAAVLLAPTLALHWYCEREDRRGGR